MNNSSEICDCCGQVGHYGGKRKSENESNPKDGWFRLYWENESALNHIYYGKIWKPSKNDQLRYEWKYKDGKRADGVSKGWFPNGQIKSIHTFKDEEKEGLQTYWYENGQKNWEETYKDGKSFVSNSWDENGKIMVKDGNGLYTSWYENGQKEKEGSYKDAKLDGLWTIWYKNGQKNYEGTYKNKKKDGLFTDWYENGQLKQERNYKNGELIEETRWDEDENETEPPGPAPPG